MAPTMRVAALIMSVSLIAAAAWVRAAVASDYVPNVPVVCKGAPLNGADALVIRVETDETTSSLDLPVLVGLKDGAVLWRVRFPDAKEINVAKGYVTCKGARGRKGEVIDLASSHPASRAWTVQRYRWDGRRLKRLGEWVVWR